ncbi:NAD-dependent epimerase/dehydratase family protein [Polymorphospora rubra]|uniref:NAD-dependent dehydratase n=1 Tax=Polymorphospora rubra TaxID=338584 RepID=A0A810MS64_9ACTN|nr:NAD(P)-dependent oxidoreductase [Polymorphospora rubra]BCJ63782.1 NAD-dependent dehydratase [Polymorphospora rubra]
MRRILVTGAGGRIGNYLRQRLPGPDRILRLLDVGPQTAPAPGEPVEVLRADLTDAGAVAAACAGVDAVVHLAALRGEDTWENILRVNVDGTRTLLEAARVAGVPRVVLASSIHAAGFYRRPDAAPEPAGVPAPAGADGVPSGSVPRPDSYYGWSKAAAESLGSLYADRFGMTVFALRIGACTTTPAAWNRDGWLSPDDCARLVDACLTTDATGFRVLWGVSRNRDRWWSLAEGAEIGYDPVDDAEAHTAGMTPMDDAHAPTVGLLGGTFCTLPLGRPR